MTIRAYVHEAFFGLSGVRIVIVNHIDDRTAYVMRVSESGAATWEPAPAAGEEPEATFTLPVDCGRVVLDALIRHYEGGEDTRSLRRDYDAERHRVDDQAKVLADVVRTLAARAVSVG